MAYNDRDTPAPPTIPPYGYDSLYNLSQRGPLCIRPYGKYGNCTYLLAYSKDQQLARVPPTTKRTRILFHIQLDHYTGKVTIQNSYKKVCLTSSGSINDLESPMNVYKQPGNVHIGQITDTEITESYSNEYPVQFHFTQPLTQQEHGVISVTAREREGFFVNIQKEHVTFGVVIEYANRFFSMPTKAMAIMAGMKLYCTVFSLNIQCLPTRMLCSLPLKVPDEMSLESLALRGVMMLRLQFADEHNQAYHEFFSEDTNRIQLVMKSFIMDNYKQYTCYDQFGKMMFYVHQMCMSEEANVLDKQGYCLGKWNYSNFPQTDFTFNNTTVLCRGSFEQETSLYILQPSDQPEERLAQFHSFAEQTMLKLRILKELTGQQKAMMLSYAMIVAAKVLNMPSANMVPNVITYKYRRAADEDESTD